MRFFRVLLWLAVLAGVLAVFISYHEPTQYRHPVHQQAKPADAEPVGHPMGTDR